MSARRSGPTDGPARRHWLRQAHQSEASAVLRVFGARSAARPAEEHAAKLLAVMQRARVPTTAAHFQHAARLLVLPGQLQGLALGGEANQVEPAMSLKTLRTLAQAHAGSGVVPRVVGSVRDDPRPLATPRFSAATAPQTIGPPSLALEAAKRAWLSAVLDPNGTGIYREQGYASQAQAQDALSSVLAAYTRNNLGAGSRVEAAAVIYRQESSIGGKLQTRYFPSTVLLGEPNAPGTPPHITADMVERLYNGGRPQAAVAVAFNHSHPTEQGASAIGKLLGPSEQDILAQADGVIYRHLRGREQSIVQSVVTDTPSGRVIRTFEISARLKEGAPLNVLQSPTQHNWSRFVELEVKLIGGGDVPFGPDERYAFNIQRKDAQGQVVGKRLDRDVVINASNHRNPVRTSSVATPNATSDTRPLSLPASGARFSAPSSEGEGAPQPAEAQLPGNANEPSAYLQLGQQAKVTSGDKVPGHPAATAGQPLALYVETAKIDPSLLPVEAKPTQKHVKAPRLPSRWSDVPIVSGVRLSRSHLVSRVRSGSNGSVVLARLNGWPVAVKHHLPVEGQTPQATSKELFIEVRSAKLLSDLGIGPHFYGITEAKGGSPGIVTDVVPGDFPEAFRGRADNPIVLQTFKDLDVVLQRLRSAGIAASPRGLDFQYYVTPRGRISVIDPGDISLEVGVAKHVDGDARDGGNTFARIDLLRHAPTDAGVAYIRALRQDNPTAYSGIKEAIAALLRGDRRQEQSDLGRYLGEATARP